MDFLNIFNKKNNNLVKDDDLVAIADGELFDVSEVKDSMFAEKMMGDSVAFRFNGDKVTLCSPANGELTTLFPSGHAFGITRNDGVEILIHIGINTVYENGNGFKIHNKKQGSKVNAGDPIVTVNFKELSQKYDMDTILIITNPNNKEIKFIKPQLVKKMQTIVL